MVLSKMATSSNGRSWKIFESLCLGEETDAKKENLLNFIRFLEEEKPLRDKGNLYEVTQRLKSLLSSANNRWIAICLLPNIIKNCDAETVLQNGVFWMRSLQQHLNSKRSPKFRDIALKSVSELICLSVEFDDVSRETSLNVIHPLLTSLLAITKSNIEDSETTVGVFRQCILFYPGPTGRFRAQIEDLCLRLIDCDKKSLQKAACKCLAVLPQCGSSGEKGMKFAEFWVKYTKLIFNTIGKLWKELNSIAIKTNRKENDVPTFKMQKVTEVEPEHSKIVSNRICALFCVFEEMVKKDFPNMVKIDLERAISLCCAFVDKDIKYENNSIDVVCINIVLPHIWLAVLAFLNALIAQLNTLLLPYENTILKIVLKILLLKNLKEPEADLKPFAKLKVQAYQILSTWCIAVNPLLSDAMSKVAESALEDIKPCAGFRSAGTAQGDHRGKGKKLSQGKKLQRELTKEEMTGKKINSTENSEIASAALRFLRGLISTSGPMLSFSLISVIQDQLASICINISETSVQFAKSFPAPYGSIQCRMELYRCVFELFNLYHHQLPTPMSTMMNIFNIGLTDPAMEVSAYCKSCLCLSDKVLRPSAPRIREYDMDSVSSTRDSEFRTQKNSFGTGNETSFLSLGGYDQIIKEQKAGISQDTETLSSFLKVASQSDLEPRPGKSEELQSSTQEPDTTLDLKSSRHVAPNTDTTICDPPAQSRKDKEPVSMQMMKSSAGKVTKNDEVKLNRSVENQRQESQSETEGTDQGKEPNAPINNLKSKLVEERQQTEIDPKRCRIEEIGTQSSKNVIDLSENEVEMEDEGEALKDSDGQEKVSEEEKEATSNDCILIDSDNETDAMLSSFVISYPDSE